jgi:hypothetical protein
MEHWNIIGTKEFLPMSDKFFHTFSCDLPTVAHLKGIEFSVMNQIQKPMKNELLGKAEFFPKTKVCGRIYRF